MSAFYFVTKAEKCKLQINKKGMKKMNKWLLRFATVLLLIGIMAGCSSGADSSDTSSKDESAQTGKQTGDQNNSEQSEDVVVITISKDDGEEVIDEKEVPIEADAILMDILKENFDVEEDQGFITSVEGIAPKEDEEKAWMYFVNGEMAPVGANEYELEPGDEVTFDLQAWE